MKRRAFLRLGTTSIGVGALYGTGAFSSVSAGRGVSVNAVEDSDALLGIANADSPDDPVFTNNTGIELVVTLEEVDTTVTFDGESSPYTFPEDGTLDPGASRSVEIESEGDSEEVLVDITAELFDGDNSRGTITLRRDFSVPQSEVVDFTGTASSAGNSGKFEFDLQNVGDRTVTLTGIGINATTADAEEVSRNGNGATLDGNGQDLLTTTIPIDSSDPETDTRQDFAAPFELTTDQVATFEFFRFRNNNNNVDMRNQNVRVTVYFGDNSSKTIDLCLDEATCGEY